MFDECNITSNKLIFLLYMSVTQVTLRLRLGGSEINSGQALRQFTGQPFKTGEATNVLSRNFSNFSIPFSKSLNDFKTKYCC